MSREYALGEICEHGSLARQCEICERDERIRELEAELAEAREDTGRLNWMEEHPQGLRYNTDSKPKEPSDKAVKKRAVLNYLRTHKEATVYEMIRYCGVNNPPAWIGFLEADGWKIDKRSVNVGGRAITVYNLKEEG